MASATPQGRAPGVTQSWDTLQAAGPPCPCAFLCALFLWQLAQPGPVRVSEDKGGC